MEDNSNPQISFEDKLDYIDDQVQDKSDVNLEDKLAKKEAKSYSEQKANVIGKQGIEFHQILFNIARVLIWIFTGLFIALLLVWFLHLILPYSLRWLCNSEVQSIERILFASTIISFAGKYFAKFKLLDKQ